MNKRKRFLKAIDLLDSMFLNSLPDPKDCEHIFSAEFEQKMKPVIARANRVDITYTVLKRVACFFVVLFLSASMFVAIHPEARAAVVDWVQDKVNEFYHYFFVGQQELPDTSTPVGSDGATDPVVPREYALGWVPEGYVLVEPYDHPDGKSFFYFSSTMNIMQFGYLYGNDSSSIYAGVGEYDEQHFAIGELEGDILWPLDPNASSFIIWRDNNQDVIFYISGFFTEDEFIKMAQGVILSQKN